MIACCTAPVDYGAALGCVTDAPESIRRIGHCAGGVRSSCTRGGWVCPGRGQTSRAGNWYLAPEDVARNQHQGEQSRSPEQGRMEAATSASKDGLTCPPC